MLEDHQRRDIARGLEVRRWLDKAAQILDVGAAVGVQGDFVAIFVRENVPAMACLAMLSGHVPTSPTLFEWRRLIDHLGPRAEDRRARRLHENRPREDARDIAGKIHRVTG